MGRVALQKPISIIRNFLRFLATDGFIPPGLDSHIDTPRIYRQEQLPQALKWETVQAFLRSIDRDTALGKRDYAIFSLIITYGLRACDIVALKLDDIKWRTGCIRICQTKTGNPLELPLTNEVGSAIYDYLKGVPRYGKYREIFLRLKAPGGILKPTAVIEAFQSWSRKSGLDIPFKGTKCLRHSYALHLSRRGLSLKTIGDILGHRSPESTAVYIRLATEDLPHKMAILFRSKVLNMLVKEEKITSDQAQMISSWPHPGFNIHNEVKIAADDEHGRIKLAQYIIKAPISLERMI